MLLVQEAASPVAVERARSLVDELPLVPNLLVHADLAPGLAERTRVFLGFALTGELRAVATAYLGFGRPALGVTTLPGDWDEEVAVSALKAVRDGIDLPAMAIDDVSREAAYRRVFTIAARHEETHYVLRPGATLPTREDVPVARVAPDELDRLDEFLRAHGATAWSRESFATGPYVWVREGGEVVAAAGVHFETAFVGQIANVLVREDRRGRGLGAAVTAAVARRLRERGLVVSLFVHADNAPAIQLYERLGFKAVRKLAYLELA
jgi:ribosomal protein S18 acetylase RimI-like enzyme